MKAPRTKWRPFDKTKECLPDTYQWRLKGDKRWERPSPIAEHVLIGRDTDKAEYRVPVTPAERPRTKWRKLKAGDIRPPGYQCRYTGKPQVHVRTPWEDGSPDMVGKPIYAAICEGLEFRAPAIVKANSRKKVGVKP